MSHQEETISPTYLQSCEHCLSILSFLSGLNNEALGILLPGDEKAEHSEMRLGCNCVFRWQWRLGHQEQLPKPELRPRVPSGLVDCVLPVHRLHAGCPGYPVSRPGPGDVTFKYF